MKLETDLADKYAVIVVGTNNILMLIARKLKENVKPLFRSSNISALGRNMQSGYLTHTGIKRAKNILKDNIRYAKLFTERIIVIGTSCSRDAKNIDQLSDWLKDRYGLSYNIISGEDEARFNGLANIGEFSELNNFILFDVGGGSTEFTFISKGKIENSQSIPLGIRRLQNIYGNNLRLKINAIKNLLKTQPVPHYYSLVGIGGTATSISAIKNDLIEYNPKIVHKSIVYRDELNKIIFRIKSFSLSEIAKILPFDPLRSDIILTGAIIVKEIIDHFHQDFMYVSDQGLQFGVLQLNEMELNDLSRIN